MIAAGPLTRGRHRIAVSFRSTCPLCGLDQGRERCEHNPSFVDEVPVAEVTEHALDLFHGLSQGRGFTSPGIGYSAPEPVGSPRKNSRPPP